jgi:hypothetical protein
MKQVYTPDLDAVKTYLKRLTAEVAEYTAAADAHTGHPSEYVDLAGLAAKKFELKGAINALHMLGYDVD